MYTSAKQARPSTQYHHTARLHTLYTCLETGAALVYTSAKQARPRFVIIGGTIRGDFVQARRAPLPHSNGLLEPGALYMEISYRLAVLLFLTPMAPAELSLPGHLSALI